MPLRVAIDANVIIAGLGWPRWPHEVLLHAVHGDFTLVLSPIVIEEAKNRIKKSFPHLQDDFEILLESLEYESAPIPTSEEKEANQDLVRQEKDIAVALSVAAAEVDYFVTYDRDFTEVNETTKKVREAIPGILMPPVFLREVMGWTSEQLEEIRNRDWENI